jgi:prepilin-type processing-associated H-X9-DG protein
VNRVDFPERRPRKPRREPDAGGLHPLTDRQRVFVWWTIGIGVMFWGLQFGFPTFAAAHERAFNLSCMANLRVMSSAMLVYSEDNDGRLPPAATWCDILPDNREYNPTCPKALDHRFGYAVSKALSGTQVKAIPTPGAAPLIFDSRIKGPNAAGDLSSLPDPPRHGFTSFFAKFTPRNNVAYVDGHVRGVRNRSKP